MKNNLIFLFLGFLSLTLLESCKQSNAFSGNNGDEPEIPVPVESPAMMAVLYQQTAAEYRALCYQAFNVAQYQLDKRLMETHSMQKLSVVVDIDETMLDNSPYEAKCILDEIHYPEGWDEWMNTSAAKAVPGALEFLQYAQSRGVEVFYITNRKEKYFNQTLLNLQNLEFPFAKGDHLFLRRGESGKKERRSRVADQTSIVMLIGDNLNDFSEIFENKSIGERFSITDRLRDKFGNRFIVLPNAMYGEWVSAIYNFDNASSPGMKAELRKNALISF